MSCEYAYIKAYQHTQIKWTAPIGRYEARPCAGIYKINSYPDSEGLGIKLIAKRIDIGEIIQIGIAIGIGIEERSNLATINDVV